MFLFVAQMPFEKTIVVDGRGHLLGRLASVVAKELLLGCVTKRHNAAFSLMTRYICRHYCGVKADTAQQPGC